MSNFLGFISKARVASYEAAALCWGPGEKGILGGDIIAIVGFNTEWGGRFRVLCSQVSQPDKEVRGGSQPLAL